MDSLFKEYNQYDSICPKIFSCDQFPDYFYLNNIAMAVLKSEHGKLKRTRGIVSGNRMIFNVDSLNGKRCIEFYFYDSPGLSVGFVSSQFPDSIENFIPGSIFRAGYLALYFKTEKMKYLFKYSINSIGDTNSVQANFRTVFVCDNMNNILEMYSFGLKRTSRLKFYSKSRIEICSLPEGLEVPIDLSFFFRFREKIPRLPFLRSTTDRKMDRFFTPENGVNLILKLNEFLDISEE